MSVVGGAMCLTDPASFVRGFAFIVFQEADAVDRILTAGPHTLGGKVIDSKKAIPHAIHQVSNHTTVLYIIIVTTVMVSSLLYSNYCNGVFSI